MSEKRYSFENLDDFDTGAAMARVLLTEGDFDAFKAMLEKEVQAFQRNMSAKSYEQTKIKKDADGKPIAAVKETFVPSASSVQRIFGIVVTTAAMYYANQKAMDATNKATQELLESVGVLVQNQIAKEQSA
jgi:hypothetical protein